MNELLAPLQNCQKQYQELLSSQTFNVCKSTYVHWWLNDYYLKLSLKSSENSGFLKSKKSLLRAHFLILIFLIISGTFSLTLSTIDVPAHRVVGDKATLICQFDMEGDTLYSVKWYKDDQEFYRYVPNDRPKLQVFKTEGISVDVSTLETLLLAFQRAEPFWINFCPFQKVWIYSLVVLVEVRRYANRLLDERANKSKVCHLLDFMTPAFSQLFEKSPDFAYLSHHFIVSIALSENLRCLIL